MKSIFSLLPLCAALALPTTAHADGFIAIGGAASGCHFALESAIAAHTSDGSGTVYHGILMPGLTKTGAGISSPTAASRLTVDYNASTAILTVAGANENAAATIVSMDGRALLHTAVADGTVDLSALAHGLYIVRIADATAVATIKIAR